MSKKKTKTSSTSTGTATTTPNIPDFVQQPLSNYYGQLTNFLNTNSQTAGASPLQTQAFGAAANLGSGDSAVGDAMTGAQAGMNYQPGTVAAGQLANTDLTAYLNPYTQSVVDTTMAQLDRARQSAISQGQGAATRAGAYGGSRHGVADAETNRGYFDTAAGTIANLYNAGYGNAQQAALTDIGNRLNADQFNVNAGLQGAQQRLSASNLLGQLGLNRSANQRADVTTQADLGAQQRELNDPVQQRAQFLAMIRQLLGVNGSDAIGQTINSSGRQTGTTTQSGGWMGDLGTLLQGAGALWGPV